MARTPRVPEPDAGSAELVRAAQSGDSGAREQLIKAYTPLVLRVGARLCGRYLQPGRDDEVSVGLMALNEAVDRWRPSVGAPFQAFAEVVVRRRMIDHLRREAKRQETPFSDLEQSDEEGEVWSPHEASAAVEAEGRRREAEDVRAEVERLRALLSVYGINFQDLVRQSPRHSDARRRALAVAEAVARSPQWSGYLRRHHALPLRELEAAQALQVSRKTLERQRKFIIAAALIRMEGLEGLSAYLRPD